MNEVCRSVLALLIVHMSLTALLSSTAVTTLLTQEEILSLHLPGEQQFPCSHNSSVPHQTAAASPRMVECMGLFWCSLPLKN